MAPMTSKNRPPAPPMRNNRGDSESEDELESDISDHDDDSEENDSSDESDLDLEIPPDPIHEERMANLRRENEFLLRVTAEQNEVLALMRQRTEEIQAAIARRQGELEELREIRRRRAQGAEAKKKAEKGKQGGEEGCQPPETEKKDDENDKDGSSPVPI